MASLILPAGVIEVFMPAPREAELYSAQAELLGGAHEGKGDLVITNYRIALLGDSVATVYLGGAEEPLRKTLANLSFDCIVSASHRTERRLLMVYDVVEVNYEVQEGFVRKVLLKLRKGVGREVVDAVRMAVAKHRELVRETERLPLYYFMGFVEFLGVIKGLRPLYYDSVSRCVAVGSSYFCIRDAEWRVEGTSDITSKASAWIDEYKSKAYM